MCSTEPVPGKSSIFNLEEKAAIISEMSGGIDKIKNFLLKMKEEKSTLGSGKELVGSETCEKIMEFLDENKFLDEGYRYFLLEAAELYEMEADSHKEFEKLTLRDIEEINNTVKDVEYFMETGILNDSILEKIGTYEKGSLSFVKTLTEKGYVSVFYKTRFSKETQGDVTVQFVFEEINGKMLVGGLWFSSKTLKQ